jgi:hypothetical protein
LFGKTNLTALQTQTLTSDPDEPVSGSTSTQYDPSIVTVTGFGLGPGYVSISSPFESGAGVEVLDSGSPDGKVVMDLGQFLELESINQAPPQTGYLRAYFKISDEGFGPTGKLTNDVTWQQNHQGYTMLDDNGPVGVDTHFYEFSYLLPDDPRPASYRVFAEDANLHYIQDPTNPSQYDLLDSDFVVTQDAPDEQQRPGGVVPFEDASVSGSAVPEPAGAGLLLGAAAFAALARKRRRGARLDA